MDLRRLLHRLCFSYYASHAQGLTKLLSDSAPGCVKEVKFDSYFGRKVAIDASMHIYQFMVRTLPQSAHAPPATPRLTELRAALSAPAP